MSVSALLRRLVRELFFGDRPLFGLVRFFFLVAIPLLTPLLELLWLILRNPYHLPALADLQQFLFGGFSPLVHKLLLVYFLALLSASAAGTLYIKDIYELDTDYMPFWHLISSFLGLFVPKIKVSTKMQDAAGKEMVERIGGPANLQVVPGYAVLTETLGSPANIYGPGKRQFIWRTERIHQFVDLHEQEGVAKDAKAITRDGISVIVENIRFNYRLWDVQWDTSPTGQPKTLNPYPFSPDAIYKWAYNRTVAVDDSGSPKPFSWAGAITGRVTGIVKDYISEHRLDDVIASREHEQDNPRMIIRNKAYEPRFKDGLREMGTRLRWWDPGEFKSLEFIESQFLSNWSVNLQSNIDVNHAHGDGQKQAYEEFGRAEAEAELLVSIVHSLHGINLDANKSQTLQNLILIRTAQVIRALNTPAKEIPTRDADGKKQDTSPKT